MSESDFGTPDAESPPFDFSKARSWRPGDPTSAPEARLYRVLRDIVRAKKSGEQAPLDEAIEAAESVLADLSKG